MGNTVREGLLPLVARLLLVSEFLIAVNGKVFGWGGQAAYMTSHGMHFVTPLLGAALAIELLGSICLIIGFQAQRAAAVMAVYLAIVSIRLHDDWHGGWRQSDAVLQESRHDRWTDHDRCLWHRTLEPRTALSGSSRSPHRTADPSRDVCVLASFPARLRV